ncbi:MAG TPA: SURF1 family protein [Actinomycetota bacterium]|nr:SURF1 family protein [Actinomycetota bacterium]
MARRLGFLLTRRWITLLVVALVVAATCIRLGIWQLDRLEQRRALNERIRTGLAARPVPFETVPGTRDQAYRSVVATGTYNPEKEVLWYGRALDGQPGHHVLTPLVVGAEQTGGREVAILVDRGWVPAELGTPPVEQAAPPAGPVTVSGFLIPSGDGEDVVIDRDPAGRPLTVRLPDPAALTDAVGYDLWPLAMQLQEQSPGQTGELPITVPPPELDEGPHESYAVQWFIFATIALVGFAILARREARDRARGEERATGSEPV